jgi:uncharacterized protein YbjT (DUF2867 family)
MESLYQSVSLPQGKYKMKVLVTGATGKVGSLLVTELIERGVDVRIFTRNEPNPNAVPNGIEVVVGDLLDTESVARAMAGIDKLFLLNAVGPSELTEALIGFGMARRARVKHVTYLSAFKADRIKDSSRACSHYLRASTMRAKLRKPMKSTSSFSKREKILRKPLSLRNSRSISLRFL